MVIVELLKEGLLAAVRHPALALAGLGTLAEDADSSAIEAAGGVENMQIHLVMGNPAIRRVLQRSQSFGKRSLQLLQPGEVIQPHGEIEVGALVRTLYAVLAILAEARHLHAQGLSNRSEERRVGKSVD